MNKSPIILKSSAVLMGVMCLSALAAYEPSNNEAKSVNSLDLDVQKCELVISNDNQTKCKQTKSLIKDGKKINISQVVSFGEYKESVLPNYRKMSDDEKALLEKEMFEKGVSVPAVIAATEAKKNIALKIKDKYKIPASQAANIVNLSYEHAKNHELDPVLVLSVIATESSFNPKAVSHAGALGLMQAIPYWHPEKMEKLQINGSEIYDENLNIALGTMILKEYLGWSDGDMVEALQRYNGSLKDSTRKYSKKVYKNYEWFYS